MRVLALTCMYITSLLLLKHKTWFSRFSHSAVSPVIARSPSVLGVIEDQQVTLPCVLLAGNPLPARQWLHNYGLVGATFEGIYIFLKELDDSGWPSYSSGHHRPVCESEEGRQSSYWEGSSGSYGWLHLLGWKRRWGLQPHHHCQRLWYKNTQGKTRQLFQFKMSGKMLGNKYGHKMFSFSLDLQPNHSQRLPAYDLETVSHVF